MERIKKPILALLSAGVFWILAIASSPPVGQSVDCDQLPAPETKTYTLNFIVHELEKDPPVKGVTVNIEQKNVASVKVSDTDCKVQVVSSSKQQMTTGESGTIVFTVTETKKTFYDHVLVFLSFSKPGYNDATWSYSTHTVEGLSYSKDILLTPKEIYP